MARPQKRYAVRVSRRNGIGLSGTTRSFSRKIEALTYARNRRNPVTVIDNETKEVLLKSN